jgi:hypothetical protein
VIVLDVRGDDDRPRLTRDVGRWLGAWFGPGGSVRGGMNVSFFLAGLTGGVVVVGGSA